MSYFNYHAIAKRLILEGQLCGYEFVDDYHGIKPALLLHFKEHKSIPIRSYHWEDYLPYLIKFDENK